MTETQRGVNSLMTSITVAWLDKTPTRRPTSLLPGATKLQLSAFSAVYMQVVGRELVTV